LKEEIKGYQEIFLQEVIKKASCLFFINPPISLTPFLMVNNFCLYVKCASIVFAVL